MAISENFDALAVEQAEKEVVLNEIMRSVRGAGVFGIRASTTSGLTLGYYGGYALLVGSTYTAIQDGTLALTASATNYVEVDVYGTVSKNTTGFTAGSLPLYVIVTGTYGITSISDRRAPYNLVSAGSSGGGGGALPFMGARAAMTTNLTAQNYSSATALPFNTETSDTHGFHDNATNNTRLTIPAGYGIIKVRLWGQIRIANMTGTANFYAAFTKNGASTNVLNYLGDMGSLTEPIFQISSDVLSVADGDYFELALYVNGDTSVDINKDYTFFAIEVVETTRGTASLRSPPFMGVLAKLSTDLTAQNFSTPAAINWTAEEYDTHTFHDNASNNTRITIPTGYGITKVALSGQIRAENVTAASTWYLNIRKNGSTFVGAGYVSGGDEGATTMQIQCSTPALSVVDGDYFELQFQCSDTSVDIKSNLSWFALQVVEAFPIACRELLTQDLTLYVSTTGSDTNSGRTAATAFATIQKAVDTIVNTIDTAGYTATIQLADGTYTLSSEIVVPPHVGSKPILLKGNASTPTNVVVQFSTTGYGIRARDAGARLKVESFQIQRSSTADVYLLTAEQMGEITVSTGMVFAAAGTNGMHLFAHSAGGIFLATNYTISGGAGWHFYSMNSTIRYAVGATITVTLTGTPAFTVFAYSSMAGHVQTSAITWSGSATGSRYSASLNGVIYAGGVTLPGDSAGSTASGGQYA